MKTLALPLWNETETNGENCKKPHCERPLWAEIWTKYTSNRSQNFYTGLDGLKSPPASEN